MLADVVRARTRDGFELLGLVHEPEERSGVAVVFVHGLGANGYVRFTDALASALPGRGVALVRGNLRDSDMLGIDESPRTAEVRKGGGAYHRFEDSVLDLESWISEAERRGYGRVVLFGHSLGSLKATHYLFRTGDPRVKGLVLASTADLVAMHEGRYTKQELADFLATARRLVAEGRGADLMPPECGMGLLFQPVSAEAYLDRFDEPASWDVMDLYDQRERARLRGSEERLYTDPGLIRDHGRNRPGRPSRRSLRPVASGGRGGAFFPAPRARGREPFL